MEAFKIAVSVVAIVTVGLHLTSAGNVSPVDQCVSDTLTANATLMACYTALGLGPDEEWNNTKACLDTAKRDNYLCVFEVHFKCQGSKFHSLIKLAAEKEKMFTDMNFTPEKAFDLVCQLTTHDCACAHADGGPTPTMSATDTLFTFLPRLLDTAVPSCDYFTCIGNLDAQKCSDAAWLLETNYDFDAAKENDWPASALGSGKFVRVMKALCAIGINNFQKDCAVRQAKTTAFTNCVKEPLENMDKANANKNTLCDAFHDTDGCLEDSFKSDCNEATYKIMKLGVDVRKPLRVLTENCPVASAGTLAVSILLTAAALIAARFF